MILDHFTVHTKNLDRAILFYQRILGLKEGYRPPFEGPPGMWLYSTHGRPVVHLYAGREEVDDLSSAVDHIAFQVHDLEEILGRLRSACTYLNVSNIDGINKDIDYITNK